MGAAEPRLSPADARGRRLDAATGIVAVALFLVAFAIPGSAPGADDTADQISNFLTDKRDQILLSAFLTGLASVFFLWWLGSLRSHLRWREGGEGRLSAAAFLAGGVAVTLTLAGVAVEAGLAFKVGGQGDQPLVRALFDIHSALFAISSFGYAALVAAASCSAARGNSLPASAVWSGSVIGGLNAIGGAALFAEDGFFATGGLMPLTALLATLAWIVAVSLLMIRSAR